MPDIKHANNAPRCEHIKFDGNQCAAPALRGRDRCRFHFGLGDSHAPFPMIEDGPSLQVALNQVARGILSGYLERKTATTLLYCFQIMSTNLKQINAERKLAQTSADDDDLPGPSLAEILLDRLRQLQEDPSLLDEPHEPCSESENLSPAAPRSTLVNRQSAMPPGASNAGVSPATPLPDAAPIVQPSCPSCEPVPPCSSVPSVVNSIILDKLQACAQSKIKNRKSKMPFPSIPLLLPGQLQ